MIVRNSVPNRDYAARSKKSGKGVNKLLILIIVLLLLGMSALALMLLSSKEPVKTEVSQPVAVQAPKSELPTPPAEIYSYIRDLETREVPIDKNTQTVQLTKEQEQQLQRQREEEQRKLELANQQLQQKQAVEGAEQVKPEPVAVKPVEAAKPVIKALTPEELAAKKAAEQKALEEKRKQAEVQKQQAQQAQKNVNQQATEKAKTQEAKPAKVVAKPATEAPKVVGKFGLQCGAFKNKAQAENMQARLAMAGYNARIASSGEWNRVFVGPVGDRTAASRAQANARSVAECMIVGM